MLHLKIKGQPFSKANSRQLVSMGGSPRFIKSAKALAYWDDALYQLKGQLKGHPMFDEPVGVEIDIYYPNMRQDLDASLILDILQKAGAYKNDRLVEELHLYRYISKNSPRAEITIWSLGSTG